MTRMRNSCLVIQSSEHLFLSPSHSLTHTLNKQTRKLRVLPSRCHELSVLSVAHHLIMEAEISTLKGPY